MNDTQQTRLSSLVVAEKRLRKPGGCAGVFFQLFDWNRSATRKLFSKKLILPASVKQMATKVGGRNKMHRGKLLLIAEGNCGSFGKNADRDTDLSHNEKISETRTPSLVARLMGLEHMPVVHPVQRNNDHANQFGPHQGEGFFQDSDVCHERGADFINGSTKLESRPRKLQKTSSYKRSPVTGLGTEALQFRSVLSNKRQLLISPVKSPKRFSRRNAARLMGAATKILVPGIQVNNRANFSIAYSCQDQNLHARPTRRGRVVSPLGALKKEISELGCATSLRARENESNTAEPVLQVTSCAAQISDSLSCDSVKIQNDTVLPSMERQRSVCGENSKIIERKVAQTDRGLCCRPPCRVSQNIIRCNTQGQKMMPVNNKESSFDRSNLSFVKSAASSNCIRDTKDFIALNRNLAFRSRIRSPSKAVDKCQQSIWKTAVDNKDRSLLRSNTLAGKIKPVNSSSEFRKCRSQKFTLGRERRINTKLIEGQALAARSVSKGGLKKRYQMHRPEMVQNGQVLGGTLSKVIVNTDDGVEAARQREDILVPLLQQKLTKLTSSGRNAKLNSCDLQETSPSTFNEELLSALTTGRLKKKIEKCVCCHFGYCILLNHLGWATSQISQNKADQTLNGFSNTVENLSPKSIFEAFSNTSSDTGSGGLDLVSPLMWGTSDKILSSKFVDCLSKILHIDPVEMCDVDIYDAWEVISDVELLFHIYQKEGPIVDSLLVDELEAQAHSMNISCNGLRGFLFNCLLEWWEKQKFYHKLASLQNVNLPLYLNKEHFAGDICKEIVRWRSLAGKMLSELIEEDMRSPHGKWIDSEIEIEVFIGVEAGILEVLLDNVVAELLGPR